LDEEEGGHPFEERGNNCNLCYRPLGARLRVAVAAHVCEPITTTFLLRKKKSQSKDREEKDIASGYIIVTASVSFGGVNDNNNDTLDE